jgi:hypothetical protein
MYYYTGLATEIEQMRLRLKHDPDGVNNYEVQDLLGSALRDVEILDSLKRPQKLTSAQLGEGMHEITITLVLEASEADDLHRRIWLQDDNDQ